MGEQQIAVAYAYPQYGNTLGAEIYAGPVCHNVPDVSGQDHERHL